MPLEEHCEQVGEPEAYLSRVFKMAKDAVKIYSLMPFDVRENARVCELLEQGLNYYDLAAFISDVPKKENEMLNILREGARQLIDALNIMDDLANKKAKSVYNRLGYSSDELVNRFACFVDLKNRRITQAHKGRTLGYVRTNDIDTAIAAFYLVSPKSSRKDI
jgi:hypothetical protein